MVPITEQIAEKVADAVAGSKDDSFMSANTVDIPAPEPPLELAMPERPPPPPAPEFPPPLAELKARRSRRIKLTIGLTVLVVAVTGLVVFTSVGRDLLPPDMQKPARRIADDVERRAIEASGDALYTFTDDDGVVHIVDALDKVPPEYRDRAERKH